MYVHGAGKFVLYVFDRTCEMPSPADPFPNTLYFPS